MAPWSPKVPKKCRGSVYGRCSCAPWRLGGRKLMPLRVFRWASELAIFIQERLAFLALHYHQNWMLLGLIWPNQITGNLRALQAPFGLVHLFLSSGQCFGGAPAWQVSFRSRAASKCLLSRRGFRPKRPLKSHCRLMLHFPLRLHFPRDQAFSDPEKYGVSSRDYFVGRTRSPVCEAQREPRWSTRADAVHFWALLCPVVYLYVLYWTWCLDNYFAASGKFYLFYYIDRILIELLLG